MTTTTYRWNQLSAAEAYDQAAPVIHPHYETVQNQVLQALAGSVERGTPHFIDLGGGSGRLLQRALTAHPKATATLVDQSEPFLGLARRRLAPFAERVSFVNACLQDDWPAACSALDHPAPAAILSTSAIHHLDPGEKQTLFAKCATVLSAGGLFINGDEHRPAEDDAYRQELSVWRDHMQQQLALGAIPPSFAETLASWRQRNLVDFDRPRQSGDDCHETIETQLSYLQAAGFSKATTTWQHSLWAVFVAFA